MHASEGLSFQIVTILWRDDSTGRSSAAPFLNSRQVGIVVDHQEFNAGHLGEIFQVLGVTDWLKPVWCAPPARIQAAAATLRSGRGTHTALATGNFCSGLSGWMTSTSLTSMRKRFTHIDQAWR